MTQQEKDHFRYWLINEVGVYLQVADKIIKHVDHYFARPVESDAVEFAEWIMYQDYEPFCDDADGRHWWGKVTELKEYTTPELYQLFLKSKQTP